MAIISPVVKAESPTDMMAGAQRDSRTSIASITSHFDSPISPTKKPPLSHTVSSSAIKGTPTPTTLLPFFLGDDMVNIYVGAEPERTKFCVHKQLLIHHSEYFRAAFSSSFREGVDNTIELKEDRVDTFSLFVHWLYAGAIAPNNELQHPENRSYTTSLLRLHILGDKYLVPGLQALTYQRLRSRFKQSRFPSPPFCKELCDNLPPTSKLRRFTVEVCAYLYTAGEPEPEWTKALDFSDTFAAEIARAMVYQLQSALSTRLHPYEDEEFDEFDEVKSSAGKASPAGKSSDESKNMDSRPSKRKRENEDVGDNPNTVR